MWRAPIPLADRNIPRFENASVNDAVRYKRREHANDQRCSEGSVARQELRNGGGAGRGPVNRRAVITQRFERQDDE